MIEAIAALLRPSLPLHPARDPVPRGGQNGSPQAAIENRSDPGIKSSAGANVETAGLHTGSTRPQARRQRQRTLGPGPCQTNADRAADLLGRSPAKTVCCSFLQHSGQAGEGLGDDGDWRGRDGQAEVGALGFAREP